MASWMTRAPVEGRERPDGGISWRPFRATRDYSKKPRRPSTPQALCCHDLRRACRATVFSTVDNRRSRRLPEPYNARLSPSALLHTCDPTSGNAAANAWRPSCPNSNSTPGSGPCPTPTSPTTATGAVVTVRVPNRFKLDWIRNQYAGRIETVLSELAGKPVRLDVTLAPRDGAAPAAAAASRADAGAATARAAARPSAVAAPVRHAAGARRRPAPAAPAPLPSRSRLNPALTFDTLVPGRANQMARTAALHVAGAPGPAVQPAVHLRRRRPRQDPPDARRRQRAAGRPARRAQSSTCMPSSSSPTW